MQIDISAAERLTKILAQAYRKYPNSCSHAIWDVITQYLPQQPYLTANDLLRQLECSNFWLPTPVAELAQRASAGELIVGGLAQVPNGHVIGVFPGEPKAAGGYAYKEGGKMQVLRSRGMYARAMSTSMGSWAGAKSNGDKTVWDPWANDGKFARVRFWRLDLGGHPDKNPPCENRP